MVDTGQQKTTEPVEDVLGHRLICDGLLCSILRAMSNSANKDEFISVIERDCEEEEILASRQKLFSFYSDVVCDKQKKPILDITRGSVRKNIEDIVVQMVKIDREETSEIFYMPWNYNIKPFNTETDLRAELIEKELCTEMDSKIESLKQEMNLKNQALMEVINKKFNDVIQHVSTMSATQPPSFAAVAATSLRHQGAGSQGGGGRPGPAQGAMGSKPDPAFKFPYQPDQTRGRGTDRHQGEDRGDRDRSASKRRRVEESSSEENIARERSQSQSKQRKFVVGTSNQLGRKMRSPPADIFVYGVHPDTLPEDIVQDLACSDIHIKPDDIVQKSREESFLKSYRISVKAEDLQKALDPAIWPLRVKVREFIHYSKRPARGNTVHGPGQDPRHQQGRVQQLHQGHRGRGYQQAYRHEHEYQHQHGQAVQEQQAGTAGVGGLLDQFLAQNRYALPEDNVPGGTRTVV